MSQEVHTCRRKEVENKHHGAVKELTSENQRFDWTEIILFSPRKNGGYIHSSLGSRSVLVVRLARPVDKNLVIYGIFKIL